MTRCGAPIYASFRASRARPRRSSRHNLCCRERWVACIGKSVLRRDFLRHCAHAGAFIAVKMQGGMTREEALSEFNSRFGG